MIRQLRSRSGFTLVELLVVIAIIGILVALLLPAVQAARESARMTQCRNHAKQLGLASHEHLDAHKYFPSGGWGYQWLGDPDQGFGRSQPGGWLYSILPYIEQENLHAAGAGATGAAKKAAFRQLLTTPIATFYCPSRRSVALYEQRSRDNSSGQWTYNHPDDPGYVADIAKCDYAYNGGPTAYLGSGGQQFHPGPATMAAAATHAFPNISASDGMLWWRSEFRTADILDGTSHTLLLGEKGFDPAQADNWQAGDPQSPYIGYDADIYRNAGPDYPLHRDDPGVSGYWVFTGPHPGGCVFSLCDGSVQIIPWNIDLNVYGNLANRKDGKAIPAFK